MGPSTKAGELGHKGPLTGTYDSTPSHMQLGGIRCLEPSSFAASMRRIDLEFAGSR